MLAVHLENGAVSLRRVPLPRIPSGFARIRLLAAGICSTDLELQRGYYGFSGTPGHEFVGEVTECEDRYKDAEGGTDVRGDFPVHGCWRCRCCCNQATERSHIRGRYTWAVSGSMMLENAGEASSAE